MIDPTVMKLELHDVEHWPHVELRSQECKPGYAARWNDEMDALLARGEWFTVAFDATSIDEQPADYRARSIWFKRNRAALSRCCAGMLSVIPDADQRAALKEELVKRSRGFKVPYEAVESFEDAQRRSSQYIARARASGVA